MRLHRFKKNIKFVLQEKLLYLIFSPFLFSFPENLMSKNITKNLIIASFWNRILVNSVYSSSCLPVAVGHQVGHDLVQFLLEQRNPDPVEAVWGGGEEVGGRVNLDTTISVRFRFCNLTFISSSMCTFESYSSCCVHKIKEGGKKLFKFR